MKDISVQQLAAALKQNKTFILLDVRENYEFKIGHIACVHIPMDEIPKRASELDCQKETYVMCRSGKRAAAVANFLNTNHNFSNIGIVIGGVEAYANEIDQSIEV
ncbi:rhodanese-like domain-containing protein [Brumimicrobium glaciale]|uniref:Rhodanese-like domain-containing protein n=1 Tax=Brumimicrobium glaciale TaxID=200475 RepID=A0A4Q4KMU1_9FLAO|nr:rhodanese-like domain-containing protein [Brumimicrobium glaciale]RYM34675.1 rhodanese-like domain-containing protein [Brumimicrobium glaciale]